MSAAEIIEEIEKLPGEDRRKVEEFLSSYRQQALRNMFAHFDSLPGEEQMTEEEILALPREIPARYDWQCTCSHAAAVQGRVRHLMQKFSTHRAGSVSLF